jgi:hypothetical protein
MFLRKNHKIVCHITTVFKRFIHYKMVAKFTASFLVILNVLLFHRNQCYRPPPPPQKKKKKHTPIDNKNKNK